ncbi:GcrA family cell cycle regulator [Minwuia thermotolerans]|uniref:GcrA cell cycle regulator n=1 Tax=Minwuia thermotolerans TaxID=2056226 RepID=A0A2M9G0M3_9PROT|nr:GcrA family cell cycle regulator [Minwuia thermotolerans]PJK29262.1 GcrA cell cycle regulator [Minwuia thermotolerans]
MSAGWTEERVVRLRELWGSGMTAAQIADELGDVTRNAVIGKANRLGLSKPGRPRSVKPKPSPRRHIAPRPAQGLRPEPEETPEAPLAPPPPPGALPQHRRCQFPIGHPGDDDFRFCDHETVSGKPYCNYHCRVAYRQRVAAA